MMQAKNTRSIFTLLIISFLLLSSASLHADIYLRDNLSKAKTGDYIVIALNKTYTLFHIYEMKQDEIIIEEITVPSGKIDNQKFLWKDWVGQGAPSHTSWIMYAVTPSSGEITNSFSFTKNSWYDLSQSDNFLSTLLNLKMNLIPIKERKRVGPPPTSGLPDRRPLWQPKMIVDGQTIENVNFDAWKTRWPKDNSELSGKGIEIYVPSENEKYPSYFPYWLQINGLVGKAKIRIIDSGANLISPKPSLNSLKLSTISTLL